MDILIHNLIAVVPAILLVLLLSQLVVAVVLRVSERLLRSSVLAGVTAEDRDAFRKRVRGRALLLVTIAVLGLVGGAMAASFMRIRALDLVRNAFSRWEAQDIVAIQGRLVMAGGILVGALVLDVISRGLAAALGRALGRSERFAPRKDLLVDTVDRVRLACRAVIVGYAAILVVGTLELSPAAERAVASIAYVLGGLYVSRALSRCIHLVIDAIFGVSGKLSALEGPLKHLGSLGHLSGVAKTATDYFVYVGAMTWVADKLRPETWVARAGLIGLRAIAIFFLSRIVVEVCILFIQEIFLNKSSDDAAGDLQRRMTLVPVAVGFVRYGIYFSALVMVLREAAIDPTPLLAGAGVLGVAIGLGAQAFVGDVVAGFFILFENLLLVGDLVEIGKVRGKVEEIGVRITKIRDDLGVLHALPNGEVRKVANHSKGYVNAVVDVFVPYEEDMKRVFDVLLQMANEVLLAETGHAGGVPHTPSHPGAVSAAEPVELKVQELTEGAIRLRVIVRVPPGKDEDIGDVLRASALSSLRAAGIGAPRLRRAVLIDQALRVGTAAAAPAEEEESGPPKPFEPPKAE